MEKKAKNATLFSKGNCETLVKTLGDGQKVLEYADYFLSGLKDNSFVKNHNRKEVREKIEAIRKEAKTLA